MLKIHTTAITIAPGVGILKDHLFALVNLDLQEMDTTAKVLF